MIKYDPKREGDAFAQFIKAMPAEWARHGKAVLDPLLYVFDGARWLSTCFSMIRGSPSCPRMLLVEQAMRQLVRTSRPIAVAAVAEMFSGRDERLFLSLESLDGAKRVVLWPIVRQGSFAKLGEPEHAADYAGSLADLYGARSTAESAITAERTPRSFQASTEEQV